MFLPAVLGSYSQERGCPTGCWTGSEADYSYPGTEAEGLRGEHADTVLQCPNALPAAQKVLRALKQGKMRNPFTYL